MTYKFKTLAVLMAMCGVLLSTSQNAEAATSSSAHTYPNGTHALYTVTYTLRAFGNDMYVPAVTAREFNTAATGTHGAGYTLIDGDMHHSASGKTYGALLSTSTLNAEGMYKIPEGQSRTFTLAVLFDNTGGRYDDYQLALWHILFSASQTPGTLESDTVSAQKYRTPRVVVGSK